MKVAYTVKVTVDTNANTPALALHEAGEKWNETKAKFEDIGGVEVVRVNPVPEASTNGSGSGRGRRTAVPAGTAAE